MTIVELTPQPMTWVFAGDSITKGVYHTHGYRCWVEHFQERVGWQLDRLQDVFINSGVSGWTSEMVLEKYDWLVSRFQPDVLSIALGTNDAFCGRDWVISPQQTAANLREMITRAAGSTVLLHTPIPMMNSGSKNRPELDRYVETIRELAAETNTILIDHWTDWQQQFAGEPVAWLDDEVHPNAVGHLHLANTTLRALGLGELEAL